MKGCSRNGQACLAWGFAVAVLWIQQCMFGFRAVVLWDDAHHPIDTPFPQAGGNRTTTTRALVPLLVMPLVLDDSVEQFLYPTNNISKNIPASERMASPFLSTCPPTSQVRILVQKATQQWILQTVDKYGRDKTVGGDEFTVLFVAYAEMKVNNVSLPIIRKVDELPSAVALIHEQNDGTYALDFVRSPFGVKEEMMIPSFHTGGILYVYHHYTCGMGRMTAPLKDNWAMGGGFLPKVYSAPTTHVATTSSSPLPVSPPIRRYEPPVSAAAVDFGRYRKVICFGDSVLRHFCEDGRIPQQNNKNHELVTVENVGGFLCNSDLLDEAFAKLDQAYGEELNQTTATGEYAILVGSYAWDATANLEPPGHYFNKTLERSELIVTRLRQMFPHVTVLWKGPHAFTLTALDWSICVFGGSKCRNRIRYMSNTMGRYVHEQQSHIMRRLDVPYLDLLDVSLLSPSWHMHGDAVHYRKWFNMFARGLFYAKENTNRTST